jgi:hypothetical protein
MIRIVHKQLCTKLRKSLYSKGLKAEEVMCEEDDDSFYNLFVCRDYSVNTFTFLFSSDLVYTQQLLCLKSATVYGKTNIYYT